MFDYENDVYGKACLKEAIKSKSKIGFGAVLVRNGKIIGRGYNRLSTKQERQLMTHVDYAIHAEQACIVDALLQGKDTRGCEVYVVGVVLQGPAKGKLTTRKKRVFICIKCPHAFQKFNTPVNVPCMSGWAKLSPAEAMQTAKKICGKGYWKNFLK
jgi:hypothetical protein